MNDETTGAQELLPENVERLLSEARDVVRRHLASHPALEATLDHLLDASRQDGLGLVVKGSLVDGSVDEWSDLDAALVGTGTDIDLEGWVRGELSELGRILAAFPATHLGLDDLWIYFLELREVVVKIDVALTDLDRFERDPSGLILVDPEGLLTAAQAGWAPPSSPAPDLEDLDQKLTGWLWYTYTKIARGELLEAYDSLATMRSWALLPWLQDTRRLPREGFRWLEERLSWEDYEALRRTVPREPRRNELLRALRCTADLFGELRKSMADRSGREHREAELEKILQAIEAREARAPGGPTVIASPAGGPSTGPFQHRMIGAADRYESALVYRLGPQLTRWIQDVRERLHLAPEIRQLEPHLTVLYLGRLEGSKLVELHQRLSRLEWARSEVHFGDLGSFRRNGTIINVHLRVTFEEGLRSLHRRALEVCSEAGHIPQSEHIGASYLPHVTIFDDLELAAADLPELEAWQPPVQREELADLVFFVRSLAGEGE